jgi:gamma-glutamylcyclotransferase (GGCT)/AIG2-like uncharacterized protein YtfP
MKEPTAVFVYGTLQPGNARWGLLEPFAGGTPRPAVVPGRLYDTGRGYPAANFDEADDGSEVVGFVVPISDAHIQRAVEILDQVEGTEHGLYRRIVVATAEGEQVWTYAWASNPDGLTPIDKW